MEELSLMHAAGCKDQRVLISDSLFDLLACSRPKPA
jgi:hypothetical protein